MLPIEWLGVFTFVGYPFILGLFGLGDLRKSDLMHLKQLQSVMWIPSVWGLITSWTVIYTLIGVSSYIFWRDSSTLDAYDAGVVLSGVSVLCMAVWMRLAKMRVYKITSFVVLMVGVVATSIATLVVYGITQNWISFGVYFLVPVALVLCLIWSGRNAFGDAAAMTGEKEELLRFFNMGTNKDKSATMDYQEAAKEAYPGGRPAATGSSIQASQTTAQNRFSPGFGGSSASANLLFGPSIGGGAK